MRTTMVLATAFLGISLTTSPGPTKQTYRKTLDQTQTVQGYPCAKGYAWFYADGRLQRCTISHDTLFGEVAIPTQSIIELRHDGRPNYAMLVHNTFIKGLNCSGGGPLGPGEGAMTVLYPSGKFRLCFLTQDQVVQGVPCARGGFYRAMVSHDVPVEFYESGRLKSCILSDDYRGLHRWNKFVQGP